MRIVGVAFAAGVAAFASAPAAAIGLGTAVLDSGLGEPLRFSLPVTLQPDEEVGCVTIRPRGDDLPGVLNTRSSVVRIGGETRIEVRSLQSVNEPTIGLVVTVGCTSPVSREFAFFLDPPIVPTPASVVPRSVVEPTVPRSLPATAPRPPRAAPAARRPIPTPNGAAAGSSAPKNPRPRRVPPAPAASSSGASVTPAAPSRIVVVPPAPPATVPKGGGDRLSVLPSQPPAAIEKPTLPAAGSSTAAAPGPSVPAAPGSATSGVAATQAPVTGAPAAASATPATADEAAQREQILRQQRDALQARIKVLDEQVAALRAQAAAMAARTQAAEQQSSTATSPWLLWLLVALAIVALLVASWLAWRYAQLRRSIEAGGPWWNANSGFAPESTTTRGPPSLSPAGPQTEMAPGLVRPTRLDTRIPQPPVADDPLTASTSLRVPVRPKTYPSAIETDFTVSDIEAAMATVRTVSPPRKNAPAPPLTDSDLRVLGGPTMPSPYEEPPSAAPAPVAAPKAPAAPPPPPARTVEEDEAARFIDFDVPPMQVPGDQKKSAPAAEKPRPQTFDFALDLPSDLKVTEFDGATSNAYKRTLVEQVGAPPSDDPNTPRASLDLELPSRSDIGVPLKVASLGTPAPLTEEERHGATALDQLFATDTGKLGVDTILDLDDRSGVQFTQADLATMVVVATGNERATLQQRMARFGDVMDQVDELAGTDALRAIALLRQYVLRDEDIPTILWLRLFELYRMVSKKSVYEALAEHFARRYHRAMVPWDQTLADKVPQTPLSAKGEIDAEIESLWGTPEGLAKLHGLLCGHDQPDEIVFNGVLQRDLLDAAKVFLLDRDSSITKNS